MLKIWRNCINHAERRILWYVHDHVHAKHNYWDNGTAVWGAKERRNFQPKEQLCKIYGTLFAYYDKSVYIGMIHFVLTYENDKAKEFHVPKNQSGRTNIFTGLKAIVNKAQNDQIPKIAVYCHAVEWQPQEKIKTSRILNWFRCVRRVRVRKSFSQKSMQAIGESKTKTKLREKTTTTSSECINIS